MAALLLFVRSIALAWYTTFMAGEIGHVVYGARVLTYLGDAVSDPSFWAGTLFPDIRHLGVISRHRTHPESVSLHRLVADDDFSTGMRVHAWVDATREQYLSHNNMKETLPWHPFVPHALKLLEDELLYGTYGDWDIIGRTLNQVYDIELQYVTDESAIRRWHSVVQAYIKEAPTDESRVGLAVAIGLSENSAEEINSIVDRLRGSDQARRLIEGFWQHLEDVLL